MTPHGGPELADKLLREGERILTFFRTLPPEAWDQRAYEGGPNWKVRDIWEHLILSEEFLQLLFEQVLLKGLGVEEEFGVDEFNDAHTDELAGLSQAELAERYAHTRRRMADFTHSLSDQQLAIRARHPALGMTTLEEMIKLIYVHHSLHARDVRRLLAHASESPKSA